MRPSNDHYQFEELIWSVSDLNAYIGELFDIDYRLRELKVRGEISNFSRAKSGHLYFTLKDPQSQISCVMWRNLADRLDSEIVDGDQVIAQGRVSVYEATGRYQLYVDRMEPAGRGDLATAFEQLKNRLAAEGLFDAAYKKPIPPFPKKLGIVTSSEAAALQDILNVLERRWPLVPVLIAPTLVQGAEAPQQIIRSLIWLDGRSDIDTIIVARGGGSMEDLWAFNDEQLARAIFGATHPVIVGVGHETDFTIADFVADLRAPTPSAAAELAIPDQLDIKNQIDLVQQDLVNAARTIVRSQRLYLDGLTRSLNNVSPRNRLDANRQHVDWLVDRLVKSTMRILNRSENRLEVAVTALKAVSPGATLARGYAIVRKRDGAIVRSSTEVHAGDYLQVRVVDGEFSVVVD